MGEKWRAAQGRGQRLHRLHRRLAGRRSRHGAAHARRPAQRGAALGRRPDRNRRLGRRAAEDADGFPLVGRARLPARKAAPGAREALPRQGLRRAVLGRCRLGALLLEGTRAAARRLPADEGVCLGRRQPAGRHHEGARLPAGGARDLRHSSRAADRNDQHGAEHAVLRAGRAVLRPCVRTCST